MYILGKLRFEEYKNKTSFQQISPLKIAILKFRFFIKEYVPTWRGVFSFFTRHLKQPVFYSNLYEHLSVREQKRLNYTFRVVNE